MKSDLKTTPSAKPKSGVARTTRKTATNVIPPLTANNLKDILWETLVDIKQETMLPSRGDAIAGQAREILRTVKIQLQVCGQAKRPVPTEVIEFAEKR